MRTTCEKICNSVETFKRELKEKIETAKFLLENLNDGRRKSFYCNGVNLLPISEIRKIRKGIEMEILPLSIGLKEKIGSIVKMFESAAEKHGIELRLRK